ncbi:unnamed protein product [Gongylonema pulchrum]|uniref:Ovule protein n=1 Tax=Gongylonema pulchrum TaxID=637853 RepID=A0A183CUE8_9BILA|nr:unnamed protein product [Gongylonema pulchrum]
MDYSMYYDDLDCSSSLLKSPKSAPKKDYHWVANGKLQHSAVRLPHDEQLSGSLARSSECEMKSILKNSSNNYSADYCTSSSAQYQCDQSHEKVRFLDVLEMFSILKAVSRQEKLCHKEQ